MYDKIHHKKKKKKKKEMYIIYTWDFPGSPVVKTPYF